MVSELTIDEIKNIAISIQNKNSIGMCRKISSELYDLLVNKYDIQEENISLHQGYFTGGNKIAEHFYLRIDGSIINDVNEDKLIIDASIRQFTQDNFYEGKADTYIAIDSSELPMVGLYTSTDDEYHWYE